MSGAGWVGFSMVLTTTKIKNKTEEPCLTLKVYARTGIVVHAYNLSI